MQCTSRSNLHLAIFALILLAGSVPASRAQFVAQRYTLTEAERQELTAGRDHLRAAIEGLKEQARRSGRPRAEQLPDVEIFLDAVDRNLGQNLFFSATNVTQARALLKEGEERAAALAEGKAPWERQTGVVVFGYRSEIDGSAQPYQAYVPADYDFVSPPPMRLAIFLHGRGGTLNELSFLGGRGWVRGNFGTETLPDLALYPYGRANNGWRFAGERDMFEALADLRLRFRVDPDQVTLRGFSMGGHGAWHIGLQHPGLWAVMSPGAGFVDTKNYQKITAALPPWQEALLHLYDPVDYAANAANLPLLAYVGDQDPAIAQHQLIYAALRKEGAPFKEYLGPNTPHRYEPKTLQSMLEEMAKCRRRPDAPVDFITYTLRFSDCRWVRLEGLERHWERAEVHARLAGGNRVEVTTKNVAALRLTPPSTSGKEEPAFTVSIDGQTLKGRGSEDTGALTLVKGDGRWRLGQPRGLRKAPGLQGPIDDALFGPLVAVAGTGTAWSEPLERWTKQELQRFREGWGEFFRGTLPERTDKTLTRADIREKNLYLFGDPGSNSVLKRILPELPLQWTPEGFTLAGRHFSARDHLPALVFPNPENPDRYVVLECGFTFSRADWQGSNARQYPHLPDYAVLRFDPDHFTDDRTRDTELAGFFDERWRVEGR
jgi:hypothetical protein